MTPQDLAAIRERDRAGSMGAQSDRHALLAHLDALTAAVRDIPADGAAVAEYRAAVLAILRGEQ